MLLQLDHSPPVASPLLQLPREVRDNIYSYVFQFSYFCPVTRKGCKRDTCNPRMTCRQIFNETSDALYRYNIIRVIIQSNHSVRKWLPRIPLADRAAIRALEFEKWAMEKPITPFLGRPVPNWVNEADMSWMKRLPALKHIYLTFGSPTVYYEDIEQYHLEVDEKLDKLWTLVQEWNPGCKVTVTWSGWNKFTRTFQKRVKKNPA
ncbi:hypothetical protein CC86DRAFT_366659 [Ophiobolus disseminans]|uniref:Uncharacterized protein n=1 Tax=Ophiobolus disseminans TaxID=1469910 RepID=A0A6A7AEX5_9PLEO|nr:hypothetical protein CC86DRAFT_366659 [Ophiobolus disseminans]